MEIIQQLYSWSTAHWADILTIYGGVVAVATVVVKLTPTQADDAVLAKVIAVVEWFSHIKKG